MYRPATAAATAPGGERYSNDRYPVVYAPEPEPEPEPELDGFVDWTEAGWDSTDAAESTYHRQLQEAARVGVTTDGVFVSPATSRQRVFSGRLDFFPGDF